MTMDVNPAAHYVARIKDPSTPTHTRILLLSEVLGEGFAHVADCLTAMMDAIQSLEQRLEVFESLRSE